MDDRKNKFLYGIILDRVVGFFLFLSCYTEQHNLIFTAQLSKRERSALNRRAIPRWCVGNTFWSYHFVCTHIFHDTDKFNPIYGLRPSEM